jgi:integrase/recombinase XerD
LPGRTSDKFYFWTGLGNPKSAVGDWQRSFRKLFKLAKVEGGHPHRFRDTFSVELLLKGVPIEDVSILLAHRSIKTTEASYAPWVRHDKIAWSDMYGWRGRRTLSNSRWVHPRYVSRMGT